MVVFQFSGALKCLLLLLVIPNSSEDMVNITDILEATLINVKTMLHTKVSSNCLNQSEEFIQGILHFQPWALRMLDASAKIPSGILVGNGNFIMGSYEECKSINVQVNDNRTSSIRGKYCKLKLDYAIQMSGNKTRMTEIFEAVDNTLNEMYGGEVSMYVGICIPNGCTEDDAQSVLDIVSPILRIPVKVQLDTCFEQQNKLDTPAIAVITLWTMIAVIITVGTTIDLAPQLRMWWIRQASPTDNSLADEQKKIGSNTNAIHQFFMAFSIYNNGKQLFNLDEPNERVSSLNGLRFLSIAWIVLGHAILYPASSGYFSDDNVAPVEMSRHFMAQIYISGGYGVDTFYFMSGLLLCYVKFRHIRKYGSINNIQFCILRYLRVLPSLAMLIAWTAALAPLIATGPLSNFAINEMAKCRDYWWRNILLINNYFSGYTGCLHFTWYISVDFQLFLLSPLILYPLYNRPRIGYLVIAIATLGCIIANGIVSYHTSNIQELLDKTYYQAYPRAPAYIVGILTGYILQKPDLEIKLKPITICCCWVLATIVSLSVVFGMANGQTFVESHQSPVTIPALMIQTFGRFAWAIAVAWITIACARGYGGIINHILSWRFWIPLSRLTYSIYLLHVVVLHHFISTRQNKFHYDQLFHVFLFTATLTLTIVVSIPFSLAFEFPMAVISKMKFKSKNNKDTLKNLNNLATSHQVPIKSDMKNVNNDVEVKIKT